MLDCLNAGLPVIVNAHGSLAELPADAVWMLDDEFSNADLVTALEVLHQNADRRDALGRKAREVIATRHAPENCAQHYAEAIEAFYIDARTRMPALLDAIAATPPRPNKAGCRALAQAIARSLPSKRPARQLLLDVSATSRTKLKTGIERVARALTLAFLKAPPDGFRVEPVYLSNKGGAWHYRYARRFTLDLLGCPPDSLADDAVELQAGDLLLGSIIRAIGWSRLRPPVYSLITAIGALPSILRSMICCRCVCPIVSHREAKRSTRDG